jgi:hypothetical protein
VVDQEFLVEHSRSVIKGDVPWPRPEVSDEHSGRLVMNGVRDIALSVRLEMSKIFFRLTRFWVLKDDAFQ